MSLVEKLILGWNYHSAHFQLVLMLIAICRRALLLFVNYYVVCCLCGIVAIINSVQPYNLHSIQLIYFTNMNEKNCCKGISEGNVGIELNTAVKLFCLILFKICYLFSFYLYTYLIIGNRSTVSSIVNRE